MLSGLALVTVAVMLVVLFGFLDALHYRSISDFFTPDAAAAAGTLGLVGGAEGVTLSIVLLGVMFGIQTSSSRYSPRIIGIFTRNPLNALVLSFALASILYTFLVRSEVKVNYVPLASVAVAELLALVNFALLFPYVLYSFEVLGAFLAREYLPVKKNMDPEWFKVGHAELPGASDQIVAEVNRAGTWFAYTIMSSFVDMVGLTPVHRKEAVYTIAVATRKVGLAAIEVGDSELAELCVRFFNTYLRAAINRSAPTFASGIMNEYRRFAIGALEWRRDLSVESAAHLLRYGRHFDEAGMPAIFGAAAEDVADLAIEAHVRDPQVSFRLAQLLVRNLLDLIPNARPIGLNGLFKGVAKLTCWSMAAEEKDIAHVLVEGIAAAPPDFVDAALSRMEGLQNGLFWEVNERVISFDWLEHPLRDEIPRLRRALRKAKSSGNGAMAELEDAPVVSEDLVKPTAPNPAVQTPG